MEEYKRARAEYLKTVGKMAFAQQCIDDKIMPLKKQKRIVGKYTYGLKGALLANINSVPDTLYIIAMLLILVLAFSTLVAVEYVSENGAIRIWDESGNHKLFKKDFCGEAYEKEIEYFGTEVEPNKFYNISDLITENAEK